MTEKNKYGLFDDTETFFVMLRETLKGNYKMSLGAFLWPLAFVFYLVSPIDLIPDFIFPIIGFGDDAAFMFFIIYRLRKEVKKFRTVNSWPPQEIQKTDGDRLK